MVSSSIRKVYVLVVEHWSGEVIDCLGVYSDLDEAKKIQKEYDLNRTAISIYAAPYVPAKRGRKKEAKDGLI